MALPPPPPLDATLLGSILEWTRAFPDGDAPSPRSLHTLTAVESARTLVLFGGLTVDLEVLHDTYILKVARGGVECAWRRSASRVAPPARSHHAACAVDGDRVVVFGGKAKEVILGDLWCYTLSTDSWAPIDLWVSSPPATPRYDHQLVAATDKRIYAVWGTVDRAGNSGDVSVFDLERRVWRTIPLMSQSSSPRAGATVVLQQPRDPTRDAPRLLIIGGAERGVPVESVMVLNVSDDLWSSYPHVLQCQDAVATSLSSLIYLFPRSFDAVDVLSIPSHHRKPIRGDTLAGIGTSVAALHNTVFAFGGKLRSDDPSKRAYSDLLFRLELVPSIWGTEVYKDYSPRFRRMIRTLLLLQLRSGDPAKREGLIWRELPVQLMDALFQSLVEVNFL